MNNCVNCLLNNGLYCIRWTHSHLLFGHILHGLIMGCVDIFCDYVDWKVHVFTPNKFQVWMGPKASSSYVILFLIFRRTWISTSAMKRTGCRNLWKSTSGRTTSRSPSRKTVKRDQQSCYTTTHRYVGIYDKFRRKHYSPTLSNYGKTGVNGVWMWIFWMSYCK